MGTTGRWTESIGTEPGHAHGRTSHPDYCRCRVQ